MQNKAIHQTVGGAAALYLAAAYMAAMAYFLITLSPPAALDPAGQLAALARNRVGTYAATTASYVLFGIVLVVLAVALRERLKAGAPALMQTATALALVWAALVIASGMVFSYGMMFVLNLSAGSPQNAAQAWQVIQAVSESLGGAGGEIPGGTWMLLASVAGLRTGGLPRSLSWLGMLIGAAGILSMVPVLQVLVYAFGALQVLWFVWVGIVMVRLPNGAK